MKTDSNINSNYHRNTRSLNHAQRVFGVVHPVKGFRRFGKEIIADTGCDPNRAYVDFLNKSLIKPLARPNVRYTETSKNDLINSQKWSVGCTKKCNHSELLPKLDTYKEYNFAKPTKRNVENYQSNFLSSDHISIRVPEENKIYGEDSFLHRKARYGPHTESDEGWVPRVYQQCTSSNRSNVDYDIINFKKIEKPSSGTSGILDGKYNNKKKGVAEFSEFRNPFNPNFNKYFQNLYENDPNAFKTYKGMCINLH